MDTGYKIHEIMSRDVFTINLDKFIIDAAKIIFSNKIGSLVVVEDNNIVGIIT